MYTVKNYWTDETIAIYANFDDAIALAKKQEGLCVISDSGDCMYCNVVLPFC